MRNILDFSGKNVLITGGTKGIGKATVDLFVSHGANVTIVSRTQNDLSQITADVNQEVKTLHGICADMSEENAAAKICEDYMNLHDAKLDALVNTVGITCKKDSSELTERDVTTMIQTNFISALQMNYTFFPLLRRNKQSSIVNISSVNAFKATPQNTLDGATRSGIVSMTKSLAAEWAEFGIRVNSVAPGLTLTSRLESFSQEQISELADQAALKRLAEPQEIASVILFLTSSMASYITGQCIVADGGLTL